jgi:hypothetical protein
LTTKTNLHPLPTKEACLVFKPTRTRYSLQHLFNNPQATAFPQQATMYTNNTQRSSTLLTRSRCQASQMLGKSAGVPACAPSLKTAGRFTKVAAKVVAPEPPQEVPPTQESQPATERAFAFASSFGNSQFTPDDARILASQNQWATDSVIDAGMSHLYELSPEKANITWISSLANGCVYNGGAAKYEAFQQQLAQVTCLESGSNSTCM